MLNRFTKILTVGVIAISFFPAVSLLPKRAEAQVNNLNMNTSYALSNELGAEITPAYPRPNEDVSINLTLYTDDLNSATITWYKDGKNVLSGKGQTSYSFKAGSVGTENKIEIEVSLLNGASFSKILTLNPASVDVVWEANSYVPPFYEGKALHPRQGSLKLVAMPEFVKGGKRIAPENLIYQWSNGLNVYQNQSGYGKNVVTVDGSLLGKEEEIEVLVTDPSSGLVARGAVNISPVDPEIVFYENDPYYGHVFDSAIPGTFNLKTDEIQILAAPYYFTEEMNGGLTYDWQLNGYSVPALINSRTAIFRKPEDKKSGTSNILLRIENSNRVLQQADGNLIMNLSS